MPATSWTRTMAAPRRAASTASQTEAGSRRRGSAIAGQPADEALARGADQHRIAGIGQAAGAGDQGDVLLDALAEAEARIEGDAVAGDACRLAGFGALQQEARERPRRRRR